jgi:hypothetical protein
MNDKRADYCSGGGEYWRVIVEFWRRLMPPLPHQGIGFTEEMQPPAEMRPLLYLEYG